MDYRSHIQTNMVDHPDFCLWDKVMRVSHKKSIKIEERGITN